MPHYSIVCVHVINIGGFLKVLLADRSVPVHVHNVLLQCVKHKFFGTEIQQKSKVFGPLRVFPLRPSLYFDLYNRIHM